MKGGGGPFTSGFSFSFDFLSIFAISLILAKLSTKLIRIYSRKTKNCQFLFGKMCVCVCVCVCVFLCGIFWQNLDLQKQKGLGTLSQNHQIFWGKKVFWEKFLPHSKHIFKSLGAAFFCQFSTTNL
jgi:predicted PurR-regulated permease PerM